MTADFHWPGAENRTTVLGANGTGKTVLGAYILSKQNFDRRPWVAMDFKDEVLWDMVGDPPMRDLKLGQMPKKKGLYRLRVLPGQDEDLEDWLWKVWEKGNIGLFCDEASLIGRYNKAFKAILRQGRSKLIPVIACTQRPVDVDRELFTESNFVSVFRLDDKRDYDVVKLFTRDAPVERPLPPHWSYWYDKKQMSMWTLKPCPDPAKVAHELSMKAPYNAFWGM